MHLKQLLHLSSKVEFFSTVIWIFLIVQNLWGVGGGGVGELTPTTCTKGNVLLTSKLHVEYDVSAGDYRVFRDDVVFWVTFSSVALLIPVLFVGCPRIVSNLHCYLKGRKAVGFLNAKCSPVGYVQKT